MGCPAKIQLIKRKDSEQWYVNFPAQIAQAKGSRMLYREPGYLICANAELPADQLLQAYLWRWEIEVNFRKEKTVIGLGQAQVKTKNSVENTSAFIVAC